MKDCKPAGWLPSLQLVRVPEVEEEKASKPDFEKGDWLPDGNVMLQLHNYAADEAAIRRFYEAWTPMPAKLYTAADTQDRNAEQPNAAAQESEASTPGSADTLRTAPVAAAPSWQPKKGERVEVSNGCPGAPWCEVTFDCMVAQFFQVESQGFYSQWTECRPLPTSDLDGWISWAGGECPVPAKTLVFLKHRDGYTTNEKMMPRGIKALFEEGNARSSNWTWTGDAGSNIVQYRLAKAQP